MRDLLFLDSMLTPKIITLVYWLGLVMVLLTGLSTWFLGLGGFGIGKLITGLLIMVGGAIGVRIWCELLIVLFKIHENIRRIADKP